MEAREARRGRLMDKAAIGCVLAGALALYVLGLGWLLVGVMS